jgi:hypothetical protein
MHPQLKLRSLPILKREMSKKKFTDGINDLFVDDHDNKVSAFSTVTTTVAQQPRKTSSKRFVTTLDSLLTEFAEDPFFSEPRERSFGQSGKSKSAQSEGYRAPVTGLDALIRQTLIQVDPGEQEDETKRRVSVVIDRQKLDRLKTIARMEGSFMKDIISSLIEEYVRKYANEKGVDI